MNINLKKKRSLFAIAFLCLVVLVGITIAYFTSTSNIENIFSAGTYKTVTTEEFISPSNWAPGDETPKTITTKNEGTIPVRVRVKLNESWTSKNNNELPLTYNDENVAIINLDNEVDWILKDGYYYYTKELAPGESTTSLIKSVTFNPNIPSDVSCSNDGGVYTCESTGNGYDGAQYKLNITTETVQANKYREIWGSNSPIMYNYVGDNPCTFEGELVPGAEYVNGQYTYRYKQEHVWDYTTHSFIWKDFDDDGWGVILTDKTSTAPITTTLCSSINNKPITSMSNMYTDSQTTSIDLSSIDTSNVTNMSSMFEEVEEIELDLSSLNTSNVTNMSTMFYYSKIPSLDLSGFDTSNVTDMRNMFDSSHALTINLSSFDTGNVINMDAMFSGSYVTNLDLINFNTSKVTNMVGMFSGSNATNINVSSFDTSKVTDMYAMFSDTKVTSLNLSNFNTSNVTDMSNMFTRTKAETLDLSSFDTSNVTNMNYMFYNSQAASIDLSNFDTSNVTNMGSMFSKTKAETLDLSSFDMSNVSDISGMFYQSQSTIGYAKTQADADKLNSSSNKPTTLTFVVKNS